MPIIWAYSYDVAPFSLVSRLLHGTQNTHPHREAVDLVEAIGAEIEDCFCVVEEDAGAYRSVGG